MAFFEAVDHFVVDIARVGAAEQGHVAVVAVPGDEVGAFPGEPRWLTEGLATPDGVPTPALEQLYGLWSDGGAGMLLSGNIQVDRDHLERPGNVVIDGNGGRDALRAWARAGTEAGNHLWMQISHPGRQCTRTSSSEPAR